MNRRDFHKVGVAAIAAMFFPSVASASTENKVLAFKDFLEFYCNEVLSKEIVFEYNDATLRQKISDKITKFLSLCASNGIISQHSVVCDETNNTYNIIDSSNFIAYIFANVDGVSYKFVWLVDYKGSLVYSAK